MFLTHLIATAATNYLPSAVDVASAFQAPLRKLIFDGFDCILAYKQSGDRRFHEVILDGFDGSLAYN
jgi:hypothetical protein